MGNDIAIAQCARAKNIPALHFNACDRWELLSRSGTKKPAASKCGRGRRHAASRRRRHDACRPGPTVRAPRGPGTV